MLLSVDGRDFNRAPAEHARAVSLTNGTDEEKGEARKQILDMALEQPTQYGCALPGGWPDVMDASLP